MFTVLFSDTSYNRLGVRLFLYPPSKPGGERPKGEGPRNRKPEEQKYRTEAVLIADLDAVIDDAISWTKRLSENLIKAHADAFIFWKHFLTEVKQEADELLTGLENLELPDDLKTHAKDLLEKAEVLRNCLAQISPQNVQNILNSRTGLKSQDLNELRILPSLIKELPGKLEEVKNLLSSKLQ